MDGDPHALAVGLVAVGAVLRLWLPGYGDQQERMRQLRILAKHAKALENAVKAQGKVASALADSQEKKAAPAWIADAER